MPGTLDRRHPNPSAGAELCGLSPPDLGGPAGAFQVPPRRAHDRVVEGQQRLGDPVCRPVLLERLGFVRDEPGIVQDAQRVREVGGLALQVVSNAAAGGVALGDRREYRVVERGVVNVGFLGKDVTGLAERRRPGLRTVRNAA